MFCANESVSRGRTSAAEKPNGRIYLNLVQVRNSLRRDRVTMVQAAESGRGVNLVSKCRRIAAGRLAGVSFASPKCVRSSW
jgi:hypothetical protein